VEPTRIAVREGIPAERLRGAADADPFHPERRRPTLPFRLPEEEVDEVVERPESVGRLRLLGTVVLPDGKSFVMCELPGEGPRVVRIGALFDGLRLTVVEPGRAVFVTADGERVILEVPKAGS
jgi:hypothetical protein